MKIPALGSLVAASAVVHVAESGRGWIDPDTPDRATNMSSLVDGLQHVLMFSDEFEVSGRSFVDGDDPRWTAMNKNDYTNTALHFYDENHVTTTDGKLNITTTAADTVFPCINDKTHKWGKCKKHFKSGMIQGWNKFCFTGGIIEIKASLPGPAHIGGFWPAMWLMGNLARATYVASSDWVWPWSYDHCTRDLQKKQLISACNPYPHYGLENKHGRGAPEVDILEAMPGNAKMAPSNIWKPYFSTSLQVAPGLDTTTRPLKGGFPMTGSWYEGMEYGKNSSINVYFYGSRTEKATEDYKYQTDALSANTQLNPNLWSSMRKYRVEWLLPESDPEGYGYIRWFFDELQVYGVTGKTLGSKLGAGVPSEPSYIIMNTAMSSTWGFPEGETGCPKNCDCSCYDCNDPSGKCSCGFAEGFCASMPGHFLVDYVRVYQNPADSLQKIGCSTPERPSSRWIEGHAANYKDELDDVPLRPLVKGGARCSHDKDCGGGSEAEHSESGLVRGTCERASRVHRKYCVCSEEFSGPDCKAHAGEDPIQWEKTGITLGPYAPLYLPPVLVSVMAGLLGIFLVTYFGRVMQEHNAGKSVCCKKRGYSLDSLDDAVLHGANLPRTPSEPNTSAKTYSMLSRPSEIMLNRMVSYN